MKPEDIIECALDLAVLGYWVFPIPVGLASSQIGDWARRATADVTEISAWDLDVPNANLAVATGLDVVVLRVGADEGSRAALRAMIGAGTTLPPTVSVIAADGADEYHFAVPDNCDRPTQVAQLAPGVSLWGLGAHVLVPPSASADGTACRWAHGRGPDEIELAVIPLQILEAAKTVEHLPVSDDADAEPAPDSGVVLGAEQLLTRIAGTLRHHGLSRPAIEAALIVESARLVSPPVDEDQVRRIARCTGASLSHDPAIPSLTAKREIEVGKRQHEAIILDAWSALLAKDQASTLFLYGNTFVRLIERDGRRVLDPVEVAVAHGLILRAARWVKETKEGIIDATPPDDVARDMVYLPTSALPPIRSVLSFPTFSPSKGLIYSRGYDRDAAAYLDLADNLDILPVPSCPTDSDVAAAKDIINGDLLDGFPFKSAADRAHTLAAMLLPIVRDAIDGPTPLHLIDAPAHGTGKSFLALAITAPILGVPAAAMPLGKSDEEIRKAVTSALLDGPSMVFFDNIKDGLDSPPLAGVLTSTTWSDRILGNSKHATMPNRAAWIATANNPTVTTEIARRCARIRLDAKSDQPWEGRTFKHPDLRGWIRANRAQLLHALLVMVQAWAAAGRPHGRRVLGSFESWSAVIGGILGVVRVDGFLENCAEFHANADPVAADLRALVELWWARSRTEPVKVSELVTLAGEAGLLAGQLGDAGERSQQARLGKLLGSRRDTRYGMRRLSVERDPHTHSNVYRLVLDDEPRASADIASAEPALTVREVAGGAAGGADKTSRSLTVQNQTDFPVMREVAGGCAQSGRAGAAMGESVPIDDQKFFLQPGKEPTSRTSRSGLELIDIQGISSAGGVTTNLPQTSRNLPQTSRGTPAPPDWEEGEI